VQNCKIRYDTIRYDKNDFPVVGPAWTDEESPVQTRPMGQAMGQADQAHLSFSSLL